MFEQMCAQTHDTLLLPTQSCRGVLMLQVVGTIQTKPTGRDESLFSMTEGRKVTLQSTGTQHLHHSSYSPATLSQPQSSQRQAVGRAAE